MRTVIAAALFALLGTTDARADDAENPTTAALRQLSEPDRVIVFLYDMESLEAALELSLGRGRFSLGVANALELPEYEPLDGANIDEGKLLAEELSGLEVDTGNERMFSLMFSFDW